MRAAVRAANGIVAAGHPLASAAGLRILQRGGNAIDAAVAAAAVCAVVLPYRTSIGGDLFALVFRASSGQVSAYNGSGAAPRSVTPESFPDGFPEYGASIATVPGVIAAWDDMLREHGRLGLDDVLRDAIDLAETGFPVSRRFVLAALTESSRLSHDPECARVFLGGRTALQADDVLVQVDLAGSLRAIARGGAEEYYRGELGARIARGIEKLGGGVTAADLAQHRTARPEPLRVRYDRYEVFGQPPASQGHVLLEELAIANGWGLGKLEWASPELVHRMVEIKKITFADRDRLSGDPAFTGFDPRPLFDEASAAPRRRAIGARARPSYEVTEGVPDNTTYLAVVDREGNAVSLIESVFRGFGSATMVPGTGILLNNRLTGFSLDPRSPNALAPGKRPVHTLNAVMALRGGRPAFVFGTPGRHAQVQTNFQVAVGLLDFEFGVQQAIEQPRWFHDTGLDLRLERRFPGATLNELTARGHRVELLPEWSETTGGMQAIAIAQDGDLVGGSDPRREGIAIGY